MEYNKRLFDTVHGIFNRINDFQKELETVTDVNKIKTLNKQIKDNLDVCNLFAEYKQKIEEVQHHVVLKTTFNSKNYRKIIKKI